ncbi:hypothetical protein LTR53_011074, partial [Teratosphaeriaceae sp. CCFEE 6253]
MVEMNPTTLEQCFLNCLEIAYASFVETSYFLFAGLLVLAVGLLVGAILVRSQDPTQPPFIIFRSVIHPGSLFASALVAFFLCLQVGGTIFKVVTAERD